MSLNIINLNQTYYSVVYPSWFHWKDALIISDPRDPRGVEIRLPRLSEAVTALSNDSVDVVDTNDHI